ncbi:MAG: DUF3365 domain-containing protein [Candidatus Krumholzibacteriota bacterium]
MKTLLILMVLLLVVFSGCSSGDQDAASQAGSQGQTEKTEEMVPAADVRQAVDHNVETCRAATRKLAGALKSALQGAMEKEGPLGAVSVCHDEAEVISNQICDEEGLTVGRTSRRNRNPSNAPDEWEKAGLEAFDARIKAGEKPQDLEMWATVAGPGGGRTFRYMKAIPTAPMCLFCHGGELAGDLDAKLTELYPGDKARGFAVGDMRGAFSVKMDLPGAAYNGG